MVTAATEGWRPPEKLSIKMVKTVCFSLGTPILLRPSDFLLNLRAAIAITFELDELAPVCFYACPCVLLPLLGRFGCATRPELGDQVPRRSIGPVQGRSFEACCRSRTCRAHIRLGEGGFGPARYCPVWCTPLLCLLAERLQQSFDKSLRMEFADRRVLLHGVPYMHRW